MIDLNAIDTAGPHDARTIVFLHAASYTRKMWLPQMRLLANEFRMFAVDMRGHGSRSREAFDFDGCVDDIAAMVTGLGLGPALFVGSSLGGCLAVEYARRSAASVVGMVLAGSSFDPTTPLCKLVLTGETIVFPKAERRLVEHFQSYVLSTMPPALAEEIIAGGSFWRAAADAVGQMRGRDFVGALRAYEGPVKIVNGQRDWVHRFYERRFLDAAQNGSVAIIDNGNHICSLDAPEEFAEIIREFASQCPFPVPLETCE